MHRRQFIGMVAGAVGLSPLQGIARQNATPAATPEHHGRPRPIVLGDGIELVDYRIYPSRDVRRIIGEISSTGEDMVDSPVVSITFPDIEGSDGFAYAPAILPVMHPGQSNMIFGVLPDEIDTNEKLESATFGLCGGVGPGKYAAEESRLNVRISDLVVDHRTNGQRFHGVITNEGLEAAPYTVIRGLVRDNIDRYVGCTPAITIRRLDPSSSLEFAFWSAQSVDILANPYLMLDGTLNYSAELFPGVLGPITAPGCTIGTPSN
jgi:hypothetical protein